MSKRDDLEEIVDVVDAHDRVIGRATRRVCHANPAIIDRAVFVFGVRKERAALDRRTTLNPKTEKSY